MKLRLEILRRKHGGEPYRQMIDFETGDGNATVATALRQINSDSTFRDINGEPVGEIKWESSCLQKKCGACAMVINGRPMLACDAKLSELGEVITVEPLRKFPVVEDLIVDRSAVFESLKELKVWFDAQTKADERVSDTAYEASRCLQCGCCLEVCPNFCVDESFVGMSGAVPMSRLISALPKEQEKELYKTYRKRVFEGCGKSLACRNICPAGIDIDGLLVSSNAAAVWKRKARKNKK